MMTFTMHFRFIKRMAILLACFICLLYDKHQLYGRWKQKKYSRHTVDEVTWWLVSFFFPLENYQSRYQSLRPYNKMVMLTQLGYILKFTQGFCVSVTYFSFLHNRVAVLIMIHAVYLSFSFTFSILFNYIRWRKDSHTSGHLKIGSTTSVIAAVKANYRLTKPSCLMSRSNCSSQHLFLSWNNLKKLSVSIFLIHHMILITGKLRGCTW